MSESLARHPIAFSVAKSDHIFAVCPTLAAAVAAARKRYEEPSITISIEAWFQDGSRQVVPDEFLYSPDRSAWVSEEECRLVERELFGAPTIREQVAHLRAKNQEGADFWELVVLRLADVLLGHVNEQLRGIPIEESGLELMKFEEFEYLPDRLELLDGVARPKHWALYVEGQRRLAMDDFHRGNKTYEQVDAEITRRRAELRAKPFVPSKLPFPGQSSEEK